MTTFWQDVQFGVRMLVKRPAFTIVAALSLALGIGANTVIFSLINTTLLRPLPFDDPDSLVVIWTVPAQNKDARNGVNFSAYTTFREQSQSFEGMGALTGISKSLGAEQNGRPLRGSTVGDSRPLCSRSSVSNPPWVASIRKTRTRSITPPPSS